MQLKRAEKEQSLTMTFSLPNNTYRHKTLYPSDYILLRATHKSSYAEHLSHCITAAAQLQLREANVTDLKYNRIVSSEHKDGEIKGYAHILG